MYTFEEVFEALLQGALSENNEECEVIPERYEVLREVCNEVSELLQVMPEMKMYPNFDSGSVTVKVSSIHLDRVGALKLKEILSRCNTFEILPLIDGTIEASVTVKGIFKTNE